MFPTKEDILVHVGSLYAFGAEKVRLEREGEHIKIYTEGMSKFALMNSKGELLDLYDYPVEIIRVEDLEEPPSEQGGNVIDVSRFQ